MADYAYTTVPGKIKTLLQKVRSVGVPAKVTVQWLKQANFTSSNDSTLIGVLKIIGFIDNSGVPTSRWQAYRGASPKQVLGDAIRQGYAELYAMYADAHSRPIDEISSVFSTSSTGGQQVISKTVATFRALVDEASFDGEAQVSPQLSAGPLHAPAASGAPPKPTVQAASGASLHIDIQIHISPEAGADQIEQIFASMAKHLYGTNAG